MKTLTDYLMGVRKEYKVKLRFAVPVSDEMLDKIEQHLKKYDLVFISAPKKTIFQTRVQGFEDPVNGEVIIIDATLGLPVSFYMLRLELARCIKVSETKVAVEGDYDLDQVKDKEDMSHESVEVETYVGKQTQIKPQEINHDHKTLAGTEYNKEFLKSLDDYRKEVKKSIVKTAGNQDK